MSGRPSSSEESIKSGGTVLDNKSVCVPHIPKAFLLTLSTSYGICQQLSAPDSLPFRQQSYSTSPLFSGVSILNGFVRDISSCISGLVTFSRSHPRRPAQLWPQGFCCDACRPFCHLGQQLCSCLEAGARRRSRLRWSALVVAGRSRL